MSSEGSIAVAAAVVALVQLWKWAGLRDTWAPLVVIGLSIVGVLTWLLSGDSWPPARTDVWPILTGIISVTLTASGTFGFTRAGASAVTSLKSPPQGGAGSEPSIKSGEPSAPAFPSISEIADELERRRDERVNARLRVVAGDGTSVSGELITRPPTWMTGGSTTAAPPPAFGGTADGGPYPRAHFTESATAPPTGGRSMESLYNERPGIGTP